MLTVKHKIITRYNDYIPNARSIKKSGDKKTVLIVQRFSHGAAVNPYKPYNKGENEYNAKDRNHKGIGPIEKTGIKTAARRFAGKGMR